MKKILSIALLLSVISNTFAANIEIDQPWVRAAPSNAPVLGVFMTIKNNSASTIKLLEAKSDGYQRVELHRTKKEDGMMKMIKQDYMQVDAKASLQLKPGSWHIMLIDPDKVPAVGESVDLELVFDNGDIVKTSAKVKKGGKMMSHGSMKPSHSMKMH
jgi:copper(I)-binding protein